MNHLIANKYITSIIHVGDLSYADCNETKWDTYGNMIQVLSSRLPWMVGAGNHEVEGGPDGTFFTAFEARYRMPAVKPAEFGAVTIASTDMNGEPYCTPSVFQMEYNYGNAFYSYETGGVHSIYLNCYSTSDNSSVQYQWLEQDLAGVDRAVTPWVLVSMHCPWYNSNTAHYDEKHTILMREAMEGLFYRHRVNVAFAGHVHAYERSYPVYRDEVVSDGTVYITIGDGGNAEGHASEYVYPTPGWSAFRNGTQYGHGIVHVSAPPLVHV